MNQKIHNPDLSHIPALRQLWKEAFGDDDSFLDRFFATAFSPTRCHIITIDNNVVAALYWFDCACDGRRIAYLYAVATAMSHRGQGLCRKLINDTHIYLKHNGYDGTILVPGNDTLFGFYEKLGYKTCCYIDEFYYDLDIGSAPCYSSLPSTLSNGMTDTLYIHDIFIYKIKKENFARERKPLLPKNSVIQEHENLDFLDTQASFYLVNGAILTAKIENNTLYAIEYLGDIDIAPSIIDALGCRKGIFRTPGSTKPFAMYVSFNNENPGNHISPSYFAFAFD